MDNIDKLKSGYVTVIGKPNCGKSTLINNLIGYKIAITSPKPQTTRNKIQTILTTNRGQVVFVDTPGINKPINKLGEFMETVVDSCVKDVDIILCLVEPNSKLEVVKNQILNRISVKPCPVFLVINKTDTISPNEVANLISKFKDLYDFDEIIPISALKCDGLDVLEKLIFDYLPFGPLYFDEDALTDQPTKQIMAEYIRESALYNLKDEVPHGIAVSIDYMKPRSKDSNLIDIEATIVCEKESHKKLIIGKTGSMLKKIGTNSRLQMEKFLGQKVFLKLWVKVKKDWRDSDFLISNFGFKKD